MAEFNIRNKLLTQNLFKQDYWFHKLHKTFFQNYIADTIWYINSMLDLNLSWAGTFYGDLVYRLKKIVGTNIFSVQFIQIFFSL